MRMKFTWPDKSPVSKGAFKILQKLRSAGFEAYVAGGAVRDALLKRKVVEIDIATSATPLQVKKLFAKTIPTGEKHGTLTVRGHKSNYEVTTFRTEGAYEERRHPKSVKFVASAEKDAQRRDFTLNALFYDPTNSEIIDYVDGIVDLRRNRIRTVGSPNARLREDALRLLRAIRFATVLNLDIERETRKAVKINAKLILKISAERIKSELDKIMSSDRASAGIGMMDELGLLKLILPELKACQGVTQPRNQHREGDVYTHSLLALEQINEEFDLPTRYAVLLHDIGKAQTRVIRTDKITFYNHQNVGAELVKKICRRLRFSKADEEKISWLVKAHMVPNDFLAMRLSRRRKWGLAPYFADLLRVYWADASASLGPSGRGDSNPRGYREGQKILTEIIKFPALKKPLISGNDVMRILKIKPGPQVGKILEALEEKKLSGKISTGKQALAYLKSNKKILLRDS